MHISSTKVGAATANGALKTGEWSPMLCRDLTRIALAVVAACGMATTLRAQESEGVGGPTAAAAAPGISAQVQSVPHRMVPVTDGWSASRRIELLSPARLERGPSECDRPATSRRNELMPAAAMQQPRTGRSCGDLLLLRTAAGAVVGASLALIYGVVVCLPRALHSGRSLCSGTIAVALPAAGGALGFLTGLIMPPCREQSAQLTKPDARTTTR
jgi:hypothetical protein